MRSRRAWVFVCASIALGATKAIARAQEPPLPAPAWGTGSLNVRTIAGTGFRPIQSDTTFGFNAVAWQMYRTGGQLYFDFPLWDLPAGAQLVGLELEACDTSAVAGVHVSLFRHQSPSGPGASVGGVVVDTGVAAQPGCGFFGLWDNLQAAGSFVDNLNSTYFLRATLEASDDSTSLGAVRVFYRLRVSPPPAVATFADVPTGHPFFQFVEALAASGITAGCGSGNFCPDAPLTRKQMAAFLSIALGLHFPY